MRPQEKYTIPCLLEQFNIFLNMPLCPTTSAMSNDQNIFFTRKTFKSCPIQTLPSFCKRVLLNKPGNSLMVFRMQPINSFKRLLYPLLFFSLKRSRPPMAHKNIRQNQIIPSRLLGTLAKIVFFTITFAKVGFIKQTDLIQRRPADIKTKPNP